MKKAIFSVLLFLFGLQYVNAQVISLGNYPVNTIITAGGNTTVTPFTAPMNVTSATAYTASSFKGVLQVNPVTGVVTITNAHPAGTYTITVKAFNGAVSSTVSFILTVNNNACSQGLFNGNTNVSVGSLPFSAVVGDFNNDGKQDIATANYANNIVSIRMGDGFGGFSGNSNFAVGTGPQALAIGDFNGDGKQDIVVSNFVSFNVTILLGDRKSVV